MMKTFAVITSAIMIGCAVPEGAGCAEYQLFTPSPLEGAIILPEKGAGVLVRRITIKPGDTLGGISRKTSGKASYYPQILLFNDIKNPDLIFAGRELLVPVSKDTPPAEKQAAVERTQVPALKSRTAKAGTTFVKPGRPAAAKPVEDAVRLREADHIVKPSSPRAGAEDEQTSYQKALTLYRQEDYTKALAAFSTFIEQYPQSSSAPDASLYKAECLFKLSSE